MLRLTELLNEMHSAGSFIYYNMMIIGCSYSFIPSISAVRLLNLVFDASQLQADTLPSEEVDYSRGLEELTVHCASPRSAAWSCDGVSASFQNMFGETSVHQLFSGATQWKCHLNMWVELKKEGNNNKQKPRNLLIKVRNPAGISPNLEFASLDLVCQAPALKINSVLITHHEFLNTFSLFMQTSTNMQKKDFYSRHHKLD